ncbi:glycosyltransferase family A protein [Phenylobacterium sp.]|uniref:polysaccharide biosynthesis protein HfsG n=1 Tax=Phenylobacterium sp. TaxID=1871053 RepID=UPI002736E307|nr:glycosyltransferase family A protein [Phenylobacterium sp.]MDP3660265.1 glycosyltransferase family A protein [Phenylobacterium sp.]
MSASDETLFDNSTWAGAQPRLSVLIPFKGDDPVDLLLALDREAADVEIVLLDDGSQDEVLAQRVTQTVAAARTPARFVRLAANVGRAKGRNRLASHARGEALLFLDSDMAPDDPHFLGRWRSLVEDENPPIAFGGFSLKQAPLRRETALHRRMAANSDCLGCDARRLAPEKTLFTSNLLIRRDVFDAEAFDEGFSGWGWEDVEWAMRAVRRWPILHIDNTATHLGLDSAATLAAKYEQSAANFARVAERHPQVVADYPSYRVARALRRVPLPTVWRPALKAFALADAAPLGAREFAMRLYRAALYAETIR